MLHEKVVRGLPGWLMVVILTGVLFGSVAGLVMGAREESPGIIVAFVVVIIVDCICMGGFTVVNPNTSKVLTMFGVYKGSIKEPGFWWVNPLTTRRALSLRVRNFESARLKVNDRDGNPVEIAAVVVWKIVETFEASFNVDDYEHFVHVQSEAAVRILANTYPYDAHTEGQISLSHQTGEVSDRLRNEIHDRLVKAGIDVVEARISHLAYAPEIAGAMLRRQQASAVIAARQKIVEGAVGMVEMALSELMKKNVVQLDEERKAAMVSNLLVVLCSDRGVEPVVNTGTLYQ